MQIPLIDLCSQYQTIATGIHYPTPVHLQPACAHYGYMRGMLSVTETLSERVVSLPRYPELTAEQRQSVVGAVKKSLLLGKKQEVTAREMAS